MKFATFRVKVKAQDLSHSQSTRLTSLVTQTSWSADPTRANQLEITSYFESRDFFILKLLLS